MSEAVVYRLLRGGRLRAKKRGHAWQISEAALEDFVLSQNPASSQELRGRLTPQQEQELAKGGRCPVCGQPLLQDAAEDDSAGWAHEFRECSQCSFSFHEHAISSGPDIHRLVGKHLDLLQKHVEAGLRARRALVRRGQL